MENWDNIIEHRKRREMRLDEKRIMDSSYPVKADYMIKNGIASEKMICCLDNQVLDMLLRNYFRKDGIRVDYEKESKDLDWITVKNGEHVPLDNGKAVGGPLNGRDFSSAVSHKRTENVKNSPDEEYYEAARNSSSPVEFWMNLNEEQQKKVGKSYKETYERVKDKAGEKSEWKHTTGKVGDMTTTLKKPEKQIGIRFVNEPQRTATAWADKEDVEFNLANKDTFSDHVFWHELGHKVADMGLVNDLAKNPGDLFGRYNTKHNSLVLANGDVEKNPHEVFAEGFSNYVMKNDKWFEKCPELKDYYDRLVNDNPWLMDYLNDTKKEYDKQKKKYGIESESTSKISDAMKPLKEYEFSDGMTEDEFLDANIDELREVYEEKDMEGVVDEYYKMLMKNSSDNIREMPEDKAEEVFYDNVSQGDFDGWYRNADSAYKPRLVSVMLRNEETRSAGLSFAYQNYKSSGGKLPFEEFLTTPIEMYRGGRGQKHTEDDIFSAYTFDKKIAEGFAGNNGKITTAKIRPIDTYGSMRCAGNELEIWVPRQIDPNGRTDSLNVRN